MSGLPENEARRGWMGLLARAPAERLAVLMPDLPAHDLLRRPEIGAVMVRGRTGATGAPFNLGEMSVTRCSVRLEGGAVGHAHVQGRDKSHALRAAVTDALLQTEAAAGLRAAVLEPLAAEESERRALRARKAAATRSSFFTMVRGEDA
ncbi:phosphonate C-P lyase system protein PhnG [Cereibacter changlensis JA139]|uniref:Phosphonate C-P lyase system protein PhnG n=1 Tax=Cereibacter changlensis JA139 TaxID=1188249 RepID=A0A2T4JNI5_9RHOB|nr:phosphonate C-P lyase system protein PhnG [Cereibacter changlensis]PTE19455.1 phosphonate C-P lyase system protein PhnG [Cereibacter changlensis JA139]